MTQTLPFVNGEQFERPAAVQLLGGVSRAQEPLLRPGGHRPEWPALDEPGRKRPDPVTPAIPEQAEEREEPSFTRTEVEAAIARARAEAVAETAGAVRQEVLAGLEQSQADALGAIARGLAAADAGYREAVRELARDTKELALAIATALVPRALALAPLADVEAMLRDVIARLHAQPELRLRMPPDLIEPGRTLLARVAAEAGFEGRLVVAADETLGPGDACLRWRHGRAERDLGRLEREARAVVDAWLPDDTPGGSEDGASADPAAAMPAGTGNEKGAEQ